MFQVIQFITSFEGSQGLGKAFLFHTKAVKQNRGGYLSILGYSVLYRQKVNHLCDFIAVSILNLQFFIKVFSKILYCAVFSQAVKVRYV